MSIPFTGTIMYLQHEKGMAKHAMNEYMKKYSESDLKEIIIHKDEIDNKLSWEHEREFELGGEMYDVISSEIKGDSIVYHCIHDAKESSINKRLISLIKNYLNDETHGDVSLIVFSDIFKVLYPPITILSDLSISMVILSDFFGYEISKIPHYFNQPSTPPPRMI